MLEGILIIFPQCTVNVPGGTPLYKPYRYGPPRRIYIYFFSRFGLKRGIHFVHFVWNRESFSMELRECVFIISVQKWILRKEEQYTNSKWIESRFGEQDGTHQRELTQPVSVTDCYFIVNALDLLFAWSIAIS